VKILISSHAFAPSIGGIETVGRLLAQEFVRLGNEVKVVTQTPGKGSQNQEYEILRRPSLSSLCHAIRWCDIYWQSNLSLRTLWPNGLLRRPLVITHHGSYCRAPSGIDFNQRVKHAVVNRAVSVAASRAVAACFRTHSNIILDPYDAQLFRCPLPERERSQDLVFLGRLVAEKGVDILLQAMNRLNSRGDVPSLTIIGTGPERAPLERLADQLGLGGRVTFVGAKEGEELAQLLQTHKILVVPSRYDEPFGVVALEGIACGCIVIGSSGGGLPEAIGPCGMTFRNGDAAALAESLKRLLQNPGERARLQGHATSHLAQFQPATVAQQYFALFRSLL
jgi:glycosyltransferase involved in cell wall biosynthesis